MSSILKVDTIQTTAGAAPTPADLGFVTANSVLSIYHAVSSTSAQSTTSNSASNITGLSITMTPKKTNSKLLIMANIATETLGTNTDKGVRLYIYGGASGTTLLYNSEYELYNSSSGTQRIGKQTITYVDDASSAARTYNIAYSSTRSSSDATARVNNYGEPSVMTIIEIGQ